MNEWRRVRLADVMSLDIAAVQVDPSVSYPVVGVLNRGRGLLYRDPLMGRDTKYKTLNRIRPGQIVYSRLKAFEGAITVVSGDAGEAFASQEFPTFSCGEDLLPTYFALITTTPAMWASLQQLSTGMGGRRERVKPADFLTLELDLPSVPEQRRMVDVMAGVDAQIGALEKEADALDRLRLADLRASLDRERAGVSASLGDLVELAYGKALTKDDREAGSVPVFGSAGCAGHHNDATAANKMPIIVGRKGVDARVFRVPLRRDYEYGLRGWGGAGSVRWCSDPHWVIDTAYAVRNISDLDDRAVYWLLVGADLPHLATQTTLPGLSRDAVYETEVFVPTSDDWWERAEASSDAHGSIIFEAHVLRSLRSTVVTSLLTQVLTIPESYDNLLEVGS